MTGVSTGNQLLEYWEETELTANWGGPNKLMTQLEPIARLVQTRVQRGVNRDTFYVGGGSYDHHGSLKLNLKHHFGELDNALTKFSDELKAQGLWDSVTLLITSDFGRTLTPNGSEGTGKGRCARVCYIYA